MKRFRYAAIRDTAGNAPDYSVLVRPTNMPVGRVISAGDGGVLFEFEYSDESVLTEVHESAERMWGEKVIVQAIDRRCLQHTDIRWVDRVDVNGRYLGVLK
jgi:hypothetical protein